MSGREDMERTRRDAYAARQRGDLDALGRLFAPHARFQMAGSSASPIATLVEGAEQYRPLLAGMIKTFEVLDHKIVSMLIDGSKAANIVLDHHNGQRSVGVRCLDTPHRVPLPRPVRSPHRLRVRVGPGRR